MTYTKNNSNSTISDLVINWHITEKCNYSCQYCFAKWGKPDELHRNEKQVENLLAHLSSYFIHSNNPLKNQLNYKNVRLNFAGGEPLLLKNKFLKILSNAKSQGFKLSLITNGEFMNESFIDSTKNIFDMIGISFDSEDYKTRRLIGRADRKGNSLTSEQLIERIRLIRQKNSNIEIKINTVVNQFNWNDDMSSLMTEIAPDKWKVLQALPIISQSLVIPDSQFIQFKNRHSNKGLRIFAESNESMTESYIMLDPKGRFYQNKKSAHGYDYSEVVTQVGVEKAMEQICFDPIAFSKRY